MRSETIDFFGDKMEWVAPHMGTDVALMLGIAHTLVENGWHDEAFLARCTTGYAVFASYLLGESDGIAKTPNGRQRFVVLAQRKSASWRLFSTTMLMAGWGMQRQQFGEQNTGCSSRWRQCWGKSAHPAAVLVFLTILPMVVTHAPRCGALFHAG